MAKKKGRKGSRKGKDSIAKPALEVTNPERKDADSKFDFGGLPDRDLKKNLGCG